jgi:hypothetical protein
LKSIDPLRRCLDGSPTKTEPTHLAGLDVCRSLLRGRIVLYVVSQPTDSYPQELALRVPATLVTEEQPAGAKLPRVSKMFSPHREIADDLAALLTVLLRRLITVHSHVRTTPTDAARAKISATGPALLGFSMYPVGHIFSRDPAKRCPWATNQLA